MAKTKAELQAEVNSQKLEIEKLERELERYRQRLRAVFTEMVDYKLEVMTWVGWAEDLEYITNEAREERLEFLVNSILKAGEEFGFITQK